VSAREFDVVIYGATGFAGRQAVRYLDRTAPEGVRWAIGGRSREKLEQIRGSLRDPRVGLIVADASDPSSLVGMARQARAIASTVGPFRRYGTPLVEACIEAGTHYADITGETVWARSLIDTLESRAKAANVKIVPFSGYDSVPSDLGTLGIVEHVRATKNVGVRKVEAFHTAKGGFNGGTLATLLDMSEVSAKAFRDPYVLAPGFEPTPAARVFDRDPETVTKNETLGVFAAPFLMSAINTRVVRRSAALAAASGHPYGRDFAYQEYWSSRRRMAAMGMLAGVGALAAAISTGVGRSMIARFGPKPGEGPSDTSMEEGFFACRYVAEAEDGSIVRATMKGEGDPGNKSTVRFLVEAALSLANDALPPGAGILTPATAIGMRLIERCRPHGISFEINS